MVSTAVSIISFQGLKRQTFAGVFVFREMARSILAGVYTLGDAKNCHEKALEVVNLDRLKGICDRWLLEIFWGVVRIHAPKSSIES
jgi:hypothetical protein